MELKITDLKKTYGNVKGSYTLLNSIPNNSDFKNYDHVVEGNITIKDIGANPSNTYAGAVNNGLEAIFASGIDVIKKGSENQC